MTQRPIPAGKKFLYKWKATEYGSYWYHSHSRGQIDDGLFGPILIRPRDANSIPFRKISGDAGQVRQMLEAYKNTKAMILGDWNHATSDEAWEVAKGSGVDLLCPDSILINGKGRVTCPTKEELADPGPLVALLGDQHLTKKGFVPLLSVAAAEPMLTTPY